MVHELGHIQNAIDDPAAFMVRKRTADATWNNLEEKEAITKYELSYALPRGMLRRQAYSKGYKTIKTINSTHAITPTQLNYLKLLFRN